jgi:hypothetical protein
MALITCPDCEASISDAAPACPKCGRPMHTARPQAPPLPPRAAPPPQERVLLENDQVTVTSARVVDHQKKTTYAMSNITSVSEFVEPVPASIAILGFLLGALGLMCVGLGTGGIGGFFAMIGVLLLIIYFLTKPKHWVRLGTAGAEHNALWSHDAAWTREVVAAINSAIVNRG